MIPLQRPDAPPRTVTLLERWTERVRVDGATSAVARTHWNNAAAAKKHLHRLLEPMAAGITRCMYCEDSLGTDIDHFQPIRVAPLRAFDWPNHLLACSHCNSNAKRDAYPCDANRVCLLVDPTAEDPSDHLTLLLRSGHYQPRTPKGTETIKVFALNRDGLVRGRQTAFLMAGPALRDWHAKILAGDHDEARAIATALRYTPYPAVLRAMVRVPPSRAQQILGSPEAAAAAAAWKAHHGT